ncbi:hypothetical protein [Piscibacillus salipiscarius]|uniref:hypothetical protein n=1 Tax=Piscibacillus salipiscarius TaxID=299480 RepID=UPI0006D2301A|nr:hypothetical protein [Piscibacillus salipiscarius]
MRKKKISEDDIDYISNNLMPLIENLVHQQSDEHKAEKMEKDLEMMKPLLSDRTFKILQLLGFNFKRAIGEPLTELVDNYITSQIPLNDEISIENRNLAERKTIEFYKILQDKEAYERLKEVNSRLFTNEQS